MARKSDGDIAAFLDVMDEEIKALSATLGKGPPLDRSYASLDRVEDMLAAQLDKSAAKAREVLLRRAERYVGETLVRNAGGAWSMKDEGAGPRPFIVKLPELGRYAFDPAQAVNPFSRTRIPGLIRETTECFDIPHRRKVTDALVADAKAELARLVEDVRELLGKNRKLEVSLAGLDVLDEVLTAVADPEFPRDRRRAIQARAVLFIGEVFRTKHKRATWSLCVEPENVSIGQLQLDEFAPMDLIQGIDPDEEPGGLRETVADEIKARR